MGQSTTYLPCTHSAPATGAGPSHPTPLSRRPRRRRALSLPFSQRGLAGDTVGLVWPPHGVDARGVYGSGGCEAVAHIVSSGEACPSFTHRKCAKLDGINHTKSGGASRLAATTGIPEGSGSVRYGRTSPGGCEFKSRLQLSEQEQCPHVAGGEVPHPSETHLKRRAWPRARPGDQGLVLPSGRSGRW